RDAGKAHHAVVLAAAQLALSDPRGRRHLVPPELEPIVRHRIVGSARMTHPDDVTLAAALPAIRSAPTDDGSLALIVRRPEPGEREVLDEGVLHLAVGLVGDSWSKRPSRSTPDGTADPAAQLTVMSVPVA